MPPRLADYAGRCRDLRGCGGAAQVTDHCGNCPIDTAPEEAEHPALHPGSGVYFLLGARGGFYEHQHIYTAQCSGSHSHVVCGIGGRSRPSRSRRHSALARRRGCSASVSAFHHRAATHSRLLRNQVAAAHPQARLGGLGITGAGGFGRVRTGLLLSLVSTSCSARLTSWSTGRKSRCAVFAPVISGVGDHNELSSILFTQ